MIDIIELNWVQCNINVQPFLSKQIFSLKFLTNQKANKK